MPAKWLQERGNSSKNEDGIGFEGPGVDPCTSGRGAERSFSHKSASISKTLQEYLAHKKQPPPLGPP